MPSFFDSIKLIWQHLYLKQSQRLKGLGFIAYFQLLENLLNRQQDNLLGSNSTQTNVPFKSVINSEYFFLGVSLKCHDIRAKCYAMNPICLSSSCLHLPLGFPFEVKMSHILGNSAVQVLFLGSKLQTVKGLASDCPDCFDIQTQMVFVNLG